MNVLDGQAVLIEIFGIFFEKICLGGNHLMKDIAFTCDAVSLKSAKLYLCLSNYLLR